MNEKDSFPYGKEMNKNRDANQAILNEPYSQVCCNQVNAVFHNLKTKLKQKEKKRKSLKLKMS